MKNSKKNIYLFIIFTFQITGIILGRVASAYDRTEISGIAITVADTITDTVISYSPEPMQPLKLLFDYYHHSLPFTRVGSHLLTGSYENGIGRYGWDDFVHSNTFDPVFVALEKEYSISMSRQPFSRQMLSKTDAVVIMNPDNPQILPSARLISDDEISILRQFVKNGGSLMVMVNSGGAERKSENFESMQLRKLVRGFGLDWNDDDTNYSDNLIPEGHPYFYDVPVFHYGAGCTLQILPEAPGPEVLLDVYSDASYTDRHVSGHGIVMVRPGKGKFILVGDVGTWTANMSRPWADNERILKQLFRYLKPDRGVIPPQLPADKSWEYEVTVAGLQGIPVANSLSQISKPHYRLFSPRERTNMPYFEASALLQMTCKEQTKDQAARLEAKVTNFRWFDEQPENNEDQYIRVEDLLPVEEVNRVGSTHYRFLARHGGKLLFKREQWVDQKTGIVLKAKVQTRIFTWVQDTHKPASTAPGKSDIVMSLAHVVTFKLK